MQFGYLIGWLALVFGIAVPVPQLYRMIKTGKSKDVSSLTYVFLCLALIGYISHAVYIGATVFIVSNSIGLLFNGTILVIKAYRQVKYG